MLHLCSMANAIYRLLGIGKRAKLPESKPLSASVLNSIFGYSSSAGVHVTQENVLGVSEVWRAVTLLGETIASIPFSVIEKGQNGQRTELFDHPVYKLISVEPSQLYTPFEFIETMVANAALHGNSYAAIERDRLTGYAREIRVLPAQDVRVYERGDNVVYKLEGSGIVYEHDEIIHIKRLSLDGQIGLNTLEIHRDNLGLAVANRDFGANFFRNGAKLGGVLRHPGTLSKEAYERLRQSWESRYGGSSNSGKTAVLEEGMDYKEVGLKPQDASYLETKKAIVADIARIFGVPQFLLEDLDRATFNNIEYLSQLFLKLTVRPWCKRIAAEFDRKLFKEEEKGRIVSYFNFDDLLMAGLEDRADHMSKLFNAGAYTINDMRKASNLNPVEGGDRNFVPVNLMPLDKVDEILTNEGSEGNTSTAE